MKEPLKEYVCDVCGKTIAVEDAMLQWLTKDSVSDSSIQFTLESIHICCNCEACDSIYERKALRDNLHEQWDHLCSFVGTKNLDRLLTFPMDTTIPEDKKQRFLEIMRRLTIPYYEEARQYFSKARDDGSFEDLNSYLKGHFSLDQESLQNIIERYSGSDS